MGWFAVHRARVGCGTGNGINYAVNGGRDRGSGDEFGEETLKGLGRYVVGRGP